MHQTYASDEKNFPKNHVTMYLLFLGYVEKKSYYAWAAYATF